MGCKCPAVPAEHMKFYSSHMVCKLLSNGHQAMNAKRWREENFAVPFLNRPCSKSIFQSPENLPKALCPHSERETLI